MSGKSLRFTRVEIVKALGIGRGYGFVVEDLSPTINIIHGPNGSGKSTLSRVMQKLLWPTAGEVEPALAQATVSGCIDVSDADGTRSWTVELESSLVTSVVNGISELVPAGSPDLHARYRMPVTELLVEDNRDFAREILRQAAGGFDLEKVAAQAGFAGNPTIPRALQAERRQAAGAVKDSQSKQEALDRRRSELDLAMDRHKNLRKQLAALGDLSRTKDHLIALAEHNNQQELHDAFDGKVKALSGGEESELKQLEEAKRNAEAAMQSHEQAITTIHGRIQNVEATAAGLRADFAVIGAAVDVLRTAEERAKADANSAIQSAGELNQATAALFGDTRAESAAIIDRAVLKAADVLFDQALACRAAQKEHEAEDAKVQMLPAPDEALPGAVTIRRGIEALGNWLRMSPHVLPSPNTASRVPRAKLGAVCLVLVVVSLTAAMLVHWGFAVGAVCAVAMFAAVLWFSPPGAGSLAAAALDAALVHRETFTKLDLPGPAEWRVELVTEALGNLVEQLERRTAQDVTQQARAAHQKRREHLNQLRTQLRDASATFEEAHGIAVGGADQTWLCLIVQRIQAWQEAARRHNGNEAVAKHSSSVLSSAQQRCADFFAIAGINVSVESDVTFDLMSHHQRDLKEKHQRWHDLDAQRRNLEERTPLMTKTRNKADDDLAAFWQRIGLVKGDTAGLSRLLASLPHFKQVQGALQIANLRVEDTLKRLGTAEALLARGLTAIESDLAGEAQLREQADSLNKEIARVEAELRLASEGHDLSQRLEALAKANANLLRQEELNVDLAAGKALVGWLREQARSALAPRVLVRAQDLVTRFTNGRLAFEVEETAQGPRFVAANGQELLRPVAELSSGERVQLLMAVRLAFLEESEERALPLQLDEVLASSDDERTSHIIDSVVEIARSGRQVFYFTAQTDEVTKWTLALSQAGINSRVIDLRELRGIAEYAARSFPPKASLQTPLAAPEGRSHREYGELLRVPGVDAWDPEQDGLHVWHVIEDPNLLYRVLGSRIERLGPLERLVQNSGYSGLGDARETVHAIGLAFRAACRAWRIGHSRPVTREVIEQADGVSTNFLGRVVAVAAAVGGDAKLLLQKLGDGSLKGWREKSTQELREYLIREGYLDEADPLRPEAIRETVLAELTRDGLADRFAFTTLDRIIASLPT